MKISYGDVSTHVVARVVANELNNTTRSHTFLIEPGDGFSFPNYPAYVVAWRSNLYTNPEDDPLVRVGSMSNRTSRSLTVEWGALDTEVQALTGTVKVAQLFNSTSTQVVDAVDSLITARQLVFNVKDYGATGDGATDDTAAIQAAIDACGDTGAEVHFPHGVYVISEPLVWDRYDSDYSFPAPSLVGAPGRSGPSLDFATNATEWTITCAVMLKASSTFPTGEYMVDWIGSNAQDRSASGFRISGIVFNCNGRGAGLRCINPFCASLADLVFDNAPANPNPAFEPEKRDGTGDLDSTGVLALLGVPTQNSFYNTIERVYIRSAAKDGMQLASGAGSFDLVNMCCVNNSARYGYDIQDKATVTNCLAQWNAKTNGQNGADWALGRYNVTMDNCISFSGKPEFGNGIILKGGASAVQKISNSTFYGCENPNQNLAANVAALIEVRGALQNALFSNCHFLTGVTTYTSHFVYVSGSASGHVAFSNCQFETNQGSALTGAKVSANGKDDILHFSNCIGINPEGRTTKGNITGAVTFDRSTGAIQTATLTGNITVTLTDGVALGEKMVLQLTQDGTGGHTVTWPSNFKKAGGALALSAGASAVDTITLAWDGTNWREVSRALNLS